MTAPDHIAKAASKVSGVSINIPPKHALALSLTLHELATNAIKYGALSCPEGIVNVHWGIQQGMLHLDWKESGGPPVAPPTQKGFGSRLLEQLISHEWTGKRSSFTRRQACNAV
jgi:two-component sensor histidine kinase